MKPPKFISDLYQDMRDRKLLPLVLVLVIAIPAIPLLLSEDVEDPPAAEPADTTSALVDSPVAPAVLAATPGLRDYRDRLDALRSKDPFASSLTESGGGEDAIGQVDGPTVDTGTAENIGATSGGGGGSSTTSDSSSTSTSTSTSDTTTDTVDVDESTEIREFLITHEIDAEVLGPGDDRRFKNVEELTTLPGKKTPLLVYVGVAIHEGDTEAVLLLSNDVVKTDGDGSCSPSRDDCQVLTLDEGQQRTLYYSKHGGTAEKFIFKLHDIERVVEPLK